MFQMIGGAVVYGFALYGLVKFLNRPKSGASLQPDVDWLRDREPASKPGRPID